MAEQPEREHFRLRKATFKGKGLSVEARGGDWNRLREVLVAGRIAGPRVHDARIAALCAQHGVGELWSADRDFGRFPNLAVVNPLLK